MAQSEEYSPCSNPAIMSLIFRCNLTSVIEENSEFPSQNDVLKNKLSRRMKLTKSSRFNYSRRLNGRVENLTFSLNVISFLTILLGVYLLAFSGELTPKGAQFIGTLSIGLSVLAIIVSQVTPAGIDSRKANDAHKCAREISSLYRQLETGTVSLSEASEKYEAIVSAYVDNHDDCDFMLTLCTYKDEMKALKDEHRANVFNGTFKTLISMKSPFLLTCAGIMVTLLVFYSITSVNEWLNQASAISVNTQ
ncbi:SLATT domain-containing protein [Marivivens sp. LCG002]|uniref:SLATT domain-containing protein n=1 Tax=Marivivens sp. LCG002 TaxID=3051171 RepID=UPI002557B24E|nr:SLATT domain-containing protein [Marivivens sp. LCG002]WIV49969.1 SLATT domain-containing protein [Marivivens sp. LCG002]